jgi:hypothetical protein
MKGRHQCGDFLAECSLSPLAQHSGALHTFVWRRVLAFCSRLLLWFAFAFDLSFCDILGEVGCYIGGRRSGPAPRLITDAGLVALAGLKDTPRLRVLELDIIHNQFGDSGVSALAVALKDAPHLRHLNLNLGYSQTGDSGAAALAVFKDSPQLETLSLDPQLSYPFPHSTHQGPQRPSKIPS